MEKPQVAASDSTSDSGNAGMLQTSGCASGLGQCDVQRDVEGFEQGAGEPFLHHPFQLLLPASRVHEEGVVVQGIQSRFVFLLSFGAGSTTWQAIERGS